MSKERSTQFERFYLKACEMVMIEEVGKCTPGAVHEGLRIDNSYVVKAALDLAVEMQQCYLEKKFADEQWWSENEDEMKAMWEQAQIEKWAGIAEEKMQ